MMLAGLSVIKIAILAGTVFAVILTAAVSYHAVNVHNGRQGITAVDIPFLALSPTVVMMIGLLVFVYV